MTQIKKRFAAHILYFDCDQFILKAIDNCAPFVEKIYVAYSALPWQYNPVARSQYKNGSDPEILRQSRHYQKVELVEGEWDYEEDQRNACLERARRDGFDYLIVHDADEFYSFADYRQNLQEIEAHPDFDLYKTPWRAFWKSLDYILLYKDGGLLLGYPEFAVNCKSGVCFNRARRTDAGTVHLLKGTCFHLSYVLTDEQVRRKINTWGHAHQFDTEKWFQKKWLGWYRGARNLHPVQPTEWREAVPYTGELPEVLLDFVSPQVTPPPAPVTALIGGTLALAAGRLAGALTPLRLAARRARLAVSRRGRGGGACGPGFRLRPGCAEKRLPDPGPPSCSDGGSPAMKIFYVSVIEQHAGWGAEHFVNRGFLAHGHQTVTLDFRKHRHDLCRHFLALDDVDVLFLQRGDWFPIELLKAVRRPRFFWASELVSRNDDQDRLLCSGLFRHIFVHSSACRDTVVRNGWMPEENVSVLLNGFDEAVHRPVPGAVHDIDVLFVGNMTPRRQTWLDSLQASCRVTVTNAFGAGMTQYLNRARIVLNIHAEEFPDTETRVFEALGCGAFLLTETLSEDNPFLDQVHLVQVADAGAMARAIDHYLEHEQERLAIAAAGHRAALAGHSYLKRAGEIAAVFQAHLSCATGAPLDREQVSSYALKEGWTRRLVWLKRLIDAPVTALYRTASRARRLVRGSLGAGKGTQS